VRWLSRLSSQADSLPEDENTLIEMMKPQLDAEIVRLDQYEIA
jgi:hypothetical protein